MSRVETADDVLELRGEAASARQLAATFSDGPSLRDLLEYAAALDREADELELASQEKARPPSSSMAGSEVAVRRATSQSLTRARLR